MAFQIDRGTEAKRANSKDLRDVFSEEVKQGVDEQ
jgi:hypothetical protein